MENRVIVLGLDAATFTLLDPYRALRGGGAIGMTAGAGGSSAR